MSWRLLVLWAGVGCVSCDASRPPCANDLDCFLGEQCQDSVCVVVAEPDVGPTPDAENDAPVSEDCRVNPNACEPQPCNTRTGECFKCEFDLQCGDNAVCQETSGDCQCRVGFHRCGTQCVSDTADTSCGALCEPCPGVTNGFGFCENQVCEVGCDSGWLRCDDTCEVSDDACVQCLDNGNCPAANPVCQGGACTACRTDVDCVGKVGFPVCEAGSCVVCTEDKKNACGGKTCDPNSNTCTNTLIGAIDDCGVCVSDDDCEVGTACIPMFFQGVLRPDAYCMSLRSERGCTQPFPVEVSRKTVSGVDQRLCLFAEQITTCEAYSQYGDICTTDDECGTEGLNDGLCKPFLGEDRCTYACASSLECPTIGDSVCVTYCRDAQ